MTNIITTTKTFIICPAFFSVQPAHILHNACSIPFVYHSLKLCNVAIISCLCLFDLSTHEIILLAKNTFMPQTELKTNAKSIPILSPRPFQSKVLIFIHHHDQFIASQVDPTISVIDDVPMICVHSLVWQLLECLSEYLAGSIQGMIILNLVSTLAKYDIHKTDLTNSNC